MGAVRAEDLDDRADVADFAIVPIVGFEGFHLLGDDVPHLALVESHPTVPFLSAASRCVALSTVARSQRDESHAAGSPGERGLCIRPALGLGTPIRTHAQSDELKCHL